MTGPADGEALEQTRKYGTNTGDLENLRDWLKACGCTHVVMESTGSYWKPIFNVLEPTPGMQVVLTNSKLVKNLRGHKTDPSDSRWLAHLLFLTTDCQRMRRASGLYGADWNATSGLSDGKFVSIAASGGVERFIWAGIEAMSESRAGALGTCGAGWDKDPRQCQQRSIDEVRPDEEKR